MKSKFAYFTVTGFILLLLAAAIFTPKYGMFDLVQNYFQPKKATAASESNYVYDKDNKSNRRNTGSAETTTKGKLIAPIVTDTKTDTQASVCPAGQYGVPPECKLITAQPSGVTDGEKWNLVLEDDFTATTLDTAKWQTLRVQNSSNQTAPFNETTEESLFATENVEQKNGELYFSIKKSGTSYTAGMIQSVKQYKYGFIEARLSFTGDKGSTYTFWTANNSTASKSAPFINIFSYDANKSTKPSFTLAWMSGLEQKSYTAEYGMNNYDYAKNYHVYGLMWDADSVQTYIDGNPGAVFKTAALIPNTDGSIVLNTAVLKGASVTPGVKMSVDYIRAWQKAPETTY